MPMIELQKLEKLIKGLSDQNIVPEKLLIGYKAYGELMTNRNFFEDVAGSAMDPNKRRYKGIKIKVTQDDYQLETRSFTSKAQR